MTTPQTPQQFVQESIAAEREQWTGEKAEAASRITPWEVRVKPMYPETDPSTWVPGVHLGGIESAMKAEIDELRAAIAKATGSAA